MSLVRKSFAALAASAAMLMSGSVLAQAKWDLAAAYAPGNFHTLLLNQFAAEVDKATAGRVKITVHPAASLFKAP
ncbi:MAG: C4-dicarboxylate ABC transporter substrate-binding protein, partial [Betaproteobacteria bacterium]